LCDDRRTFALKALESLKGKEVPEKLRAQFSTLQAEMKSISKRVRVLDPLSISGRQCAEIFALEELVRETCDAHEGQFKRHNVKIEYDFTKKSVHIRAVKGMVFQILKNLISNSIYWLDSRSERERSFRPLIKVAVESGPPYIDV
jgi:C4-dicarboxylate-specific signal transduction histidine kinase